MALIRVLAVKLPLRFSKQLACAAVLCSLVLSALGTNSSAQAARLQSVRMHEAPDSTRIVFDTTQSVSYKVFSLNNPERVVIDIAGIDAGFDPILLPVGSDRVQGLRAARRNDGYRIVVDTASALTPKHFTLKPIDPYGHRLVVDLFIADPKPVTPAPVQSRNRPVVIAVDAGHGGDDPGALGPGKIQEKRVVLQIAKRVVKKLNAGQGFKGVLVRDGDYYLPHRKRTEIARENRADLFVSIHADAFKEPGVQGASVYTLSDRGATSETAAWLAERENRSDLLGGVGDVSLVDKGQVLAQVLLDLSMDANRLLSIDAGEAVLANLGRITKLHKKRVEQAAFVVLKSPDMPSLLVETGFISNPSEARRLNQAEHQDKLARAVAQGVIQYMRNNPPPGTLLAAQDAASGTGDVRHVIVRGDTLSTIADRYGVRTSVLRSRNGLRSDKIKIGQVILIPDGA